MRLHRFVGFGLALAALACAHSPGEKAAPGGGRPTRIILFVADGGGVAHWTAARLAADALAVDDFPVAGLVDTRGSARRVTDSAAGATAYASGIRTFNGALGVGPDTASHPTVLEVAEQRGLATGLLTTTAIVDATPGAFAAHVPSRRMLGRIAMEMAEKDIEVLLGGGRAAFDGSDPSGRTPDLLPALRARYTYVQTPAEFRALQLDTVARLLGLFTPEGLPAITDQQPSQSEMTRAALAILSRDPEGFFLMSEMEGSDETAHENLPLPAVTATMLELDRAIRVALEYRASHPETLIIVTADHETGGLAIDMDSLGVPFARYTTRGHTAAMVPLFAVGPEAERFRGMRRNDEVGRILLSLVGQAGEAPR